MFETLIGSGKHTPIPLNPRIFLEDWHDEMLVTRTGRTVSLLTVPQPEFIAKRR